MSMLAPRVKKILHSPFLTPFLVVSYPVTSLLASNLGEVDLSQGVRPWLVGVSATFILVFALRWVVGSWERAGIAVAGFALLFFAYGHVYGLLQEQRLLEVEIGRHRYMLAAAAMLTALWFWVSLRVIRHTGRSLSFIHLTLLVSMLPPLARLGSDQIQLFFMRTPSPSTTTPSAIRREYNGGASPPDIFYIILDGYARADILQEKYGYDNSDFLDALRRRGFTVAERSRSNYSQTVLSLASSLNMSYVDEVVPDLEPDSDNRRPLVEKLKRSTVRAFLESSGYRTIAFETGYSSTQIKDGYRYVTVDLSLDKGLQAARFGLSLTPFESLLLESSLARVIFDLHILEKLGFPATALDTGYRLHRARVLTTLHGLKSLPEVDGPLFVFAHIIAPHPPFVFGSHGELVPQEEPFSIQDGDRFPGSRQAYLQRYIGQVQFLNEQILQVVDRLLADENATPVILLQADHGSGVDLIWEDPQASDVQERLSILNAYFIPGPGEDQLYPAITPVNSFRVVLSTIFEADLPLLEDVSYHSTWSSPFDLHVVSATRNGP